MFYRHIYTYIYDNKLKKYLLIDWYKMYDNENKFCL